MVFRGLERTEPPSGFWAGTQQQYFDLYAATARAIKSVSPDYKVGGPATAGCGWVPEFIHFCDTNHAPVDFISTHTYGVESGYLDVTGTPGTAVPCSTEAAKNKPGAAATATPGPLRGRGTRFSGRSKALPFSQACIGRLARL